MNADKSERWWSDHIAHSTRFKQDQLEQLTLVGLHISQLPLVYMPKRISETLPNNSNNIFMMHHCAFFAVICFALKA